MEKKRIEVLERESLAFNIMHEMLCSGKWAMDFNREGKMTRVYWSDEFWIKRRQNTFSKNRGYHEQAGKRLFGVRTDRI